MAPRSGARSADGRRDAAKPRRGANHLQNEKSPFLLQHAHNPVDWYPWGEEAFAKARREDKPIFLSVGYSTCHWCHVMARESFENEDVARILNAGFVCIQVDREERPDVDRTFMAFVEALTGSGGWPLNVFLTPDLKPFYGGTYFPPDRRGNLPGLVEVLHAVSERWKTHRADVVESAHRADADLRKLSQPPPGGRSASGTPGAACIDSAYAVEKVRYDTQFAGFGPAPKFPRPCELLFLHRVYVRTHDPRALEMSRATLAAMADGGIHDQLGGGFHRYSTDPSWRLPHFEKMLSDQAQLVIAYLEAYQLTGEVRFADVARDILSYVRRDMTADNGGFLTAEDADSPADARHPEPLVEGAFYLWTQAAIDALLPAPDAKLFSRHYGVQPAGNLGNALPGQNVLYIAESLEETASALGLNPEAARAQIESARARLIEARSRRPRPHRDDKVLAGWNGLMISACARAAAILRTGDELESARRAADFLVGTLWDDEHRQLRRRYRDGEAAIPAFNTDYACVVQGLLDLYEVSFEPRWFEWACKLTDRQIELCADSTGGFFEAAGSDPNLPLRAKEDYDGAEPTSNSVTAMNLLRLGEMADSARYRKLAEKTLTAYAPILEHHGVALPAMLAALDFHLSSPRQIIIAGKPGAPDTDRLLATVNARFLPNRILLLADGGAGQAALAASLPLLSRFGMESGRATAYVCQDYTCKLPVTQPTDLAALLDGASPHRSMR